MTRSAPPPNCALDMFDEQHIVSIIIFLLLLNGGKLIMSDSSPCVEDYTDLSTCYTWFLSSRLNSKYLCNCMRNVDELQRNDIRAYNKRYLTTITTIQVNWFNQFNISIAASHRSFDSHWSFKRRTISSQ